MQTNRRDTQLPSKDRKEVGAFYTQNFIARYMLRTAIESYLSEAKDTLLLLPSIKVLDLSCGDGVFLSEAYFCLLEKYKMHLPTFQNPEKWIVENNLFGIDTDIVAVKICKTNLLNLSGFECDNIKAGNSLIDDKNLKIINEKGAEVLYEKSFDWAAIFPKVFANGGKFDLVIGNPPYIRQEIIEDWQKKYLEKRYKNAAKGAADLYVYFYAKGLEMLQPDGILAYITPNKWFKTKYGEGLRKLLKPLEIKQIVDFFENRVFEDASTEPQIIVLKNKLSNQDFDYFPITEELVGKIGLENFGEHLPERLIVEKKNLEESEWVFTTGKKQHLLDTIAGKKGLPTVSLKDYTNDNIYRGIVTGLNKAFIIDRATKEALIKQDVRSADLIKPYIQPTDIKKWHLEGKEESYFINTDYDIEISATKYKAIHKYLKQFEKELKERQDKGKTHYNLRSCNYYQEFDKPKLMYIYTALEHHFYYDTEGYYINNSGYFIADADLFLCAYLNSPIFKFYKKLKFVAYGNADEGGRNKLDYNKMVQVPVLVVLPAQKQPIEQKVADLQILSKELQKKSEKLLNEAKDKFKPEKINGNLRNWYNLTWDKFKSEIKKYGGVVIDKQSFDWVDIFKENQKEAQVLALEIRRQEQELNEMLYTLYGFSPAKIELIENAN